MTLLEAGEVDPYVKSESLPDNSKTNTKVAVAKNFDELVMKNTKDVLIEFYAPWCGHCKKLTPIYEELGDKMAAEEVEIVKMDATANDVPPQFNVRGFPTLFWLPKVNFLWFLGNLFFTSTLPPIKFFLFYMVLGTSKTLVSKNNLCVKIWFSPSSPFIVFLLRENISKHLTTERLSMEIKIKKFSLKSVLLALRCRWLANNTGIRIRIFILIFVKINL